MMARCPACCCWFSWWYRGHKHDLKVEQGQREFCFSVAQSCPTLCHPMDCSMPSFHVLHYLWEFVQTQVHWVRDAIEPSHSLLPPSPPAFNPSQDQGLFQWVSSLHQVAKVLEPQLHHQSFQWIFRVDFLWDWLLWSPCIKNLKVKVTTKINL